MLQHAVDSAQTPWWELVMTLRKSCKASPKCWHMEPQFSWRQRSKANRKCRRSGMRARSIPAGVSLRGDQHQSWTCRFWRSRMAEGG